VTGEPDRRLAVRRRLSMRLVRSVNLPQHSDQHRSEHPVLLAVDQKLGEGATLRVTPELSDPVSPIEVGSMRTWSSSARGAGPEGVQAFSESEPLARRVSRLEATPSNRRPRIGVPVHVHSRSLTGVTRPASSPCGNQSPSRLRGASAWTEISTIASGS
jgi:hypothetical protein